MTISQYSVGAVKKIRGHDGYGYSCNLLKNNKKVAEVLEDGWGGGLQIRWLDTTSATVHTRTYDDKPHSFEGTLEESLFYAEVLKLPKIPAYDNIEEMFTNPDIVIDEMVNDFLTLKQVTSELKKNLTIKSADGQILIWKISPTHTLDVLKKHVLQKYPTCVILNELPIDNVLKIYKEAKIIV